ncbi:uncharacterized protein ASCRUDRAFT_68794 [Ascoidea rubescens DSM 1968]|uniref:Uncharacterized protein n=1 Tax=Ascoidea rubescens DSM 1968 TaxID=1344418 RepID=A0A1D2VN17_9ASCO|nr:hypothetical protein ASCRUDRAFT_68794 [Ascoidea rubescens DSM 1968]ODV63003.1 hypothetical protein ASCRUDRAFT_68794 [Ascoidea rubescens DSM 1968]
MSRARQDYIARIRYQNDLPPPPCPPKLIKYDNNPDILSSKSLINSNHLLSNLFRKNPFNDLIPFDSNLGMPLDVSALPGIFDGSNIPQNFINPLNDSTKFPSLYPLFQVNEQDIINKNNNAGNNENDFSFDYNNNNNSTIPLHPNDKLLLRDPNLLSNQNKAIDNPVSFLRRTEYVANFDNENDKKSFSNSVKDKNKLDKINKINRLNNFNNISGNNIFIKRSNDYAVNKKYKQLKPLNSYQKKLKIDQLIDDDLSKTDPHSILSSVEDTFDNNKDDLLKIKHPVKKHLKVKKIYELLPDIQMLDQSFIQLKFIGSSSIVRSKIQDLRFSNINNIDIKNYRAQDDPTLLTSIFKSITMESGPEWLSLLQIDNINEASKLNKLLSSKGGNINNSDDSDKEINNNLKTFKFNRVRDYDLFNYENKSKNLNNLKSFKLSFSEEDNKAYFIPISSKIDLKKRRIDYNNINLTNAVNIDQINLSIRDPTSVELEERDREKAVYDKCFDITDDLKNNDLQNEDVTHDFTTEINDNINDDTQISQDDQHHEYQDDEELESEVSE